MDKTKKILMLLCLSPALQAAELQSILTMALQQDPLIIEAQANEQAAVSKIKESQALHYPVLAVTANQVINQSHEHR